MSSTYEQLGDALFAFIQAIDISAAKPEDWPDETLQWGDKLDRPPKANELNRYPAFVVMPSNDGQESGDTETDLEPVTYSAFVIVSYAEADMAERMLKRLADIVRTAFRELRAAPYTLLPGSYNLSFAGEWGGTPDQGERYYKLNVTVQVEEPITP